MKRIGIFGGSFDPVHDGHIHLATLAREAADLDEVWFLPCQISPHKTARPPTPGTTRAGWLRAALAGIPWAKTDLTELETEGPSFSHATMEKLVSRHPGNKWFWIMGGDQWNALPTWRHPEILASLAEFIVLARNGAEILPLEGYRMRKVHGEHPASATAIRASLAAGDTDIPHLDPVVARLIAARDFPRL
jgi:nicotinate-nucleotide adenylyltransferase